VNLEYNLRHIYYDRPRGHRASSNYFEDIKSEELYLEGEAKISAETSFRLPVLTRLIPMLHYGQETAGDSTSRLDRKSLNLGPSCGLILVMVN
jgi:hypothetical protein